MTSTDPSVPRPCVCNISVYVPTSSFGQYVLPRPPLTVQHASAAPCIAVPYSVREAMLPLPKARHTSLHQVLRVYAADRQVHTMPCMLGLHTMTGIRNPMDGRCYLPSGVCLGYTQRALCWVHAQQAICDACARWPYSQPRLGAAYAAHVTNMA